MICIGVRREQATAHRATRQRPLPALGNAGRLSPACAARTVIGSPAYKPAAGEAIDLFAEVLTGRKRPLPPQAHTADTAFWRCLSTSESTRTVGGERQRGNARRMIHARSQALP